MQIAENHGRYQRARLLPVGVAYSVSIILCTKVMNDGVRVRSLPLVRRAQ